jgi:arginine:ornithine antiporter/lysine permease
MSLFVLPDFIFMRIKMFTKEKDHKLGLFALIAMCIGPMIGAGLFDLPMNISRTTGVVALLIAWMVTFVGMICLTWVFRNLSLRCSHLDAGIYAYAKAGLGDYFGFNSAWGYWISAWLGNIGYLIMLCTALSLFFPVFGDGTSWGAIIFSSIVIWSVTYLCLRGISSATMVNSIITVAKVIPVLFFIAVAASFFDYHVFVSDVWQTAKLGSITDQVRNMMLVTVWIFIGIEGASVLSARARNRKDIGRATLISFLVMFFILAAISLLPYGILTQSELSALKTPSTGTLLFHVIGKWGNTLINLGLIIAVLGAFLSWVLIAAEVPYIAGKKDGLFPKVFTIENKAHFPAGALIITAICQQLYLIVVHFSHLGYLATVLFAAAMILLPYLLAAIYALILAITGKTYEMAGKKERIKDLLISSVAVIYGIWLLYAALKYLFLCSLVYLIGGIIFIVNRKQKQQKVFNKYETILFLLVGVFSVISVVGLVLGKISLE